MTRLKRCPFCGSDALENLDSAKYGGSVMCIDCGARGPIPDRLERKRQVEFEWGGLQAWNVRAKS